MNIVYKIQTVISSIGAIGFFIMPLIFALIRFLMFLSGHIIERRKKFWFIIEFFCMIIYPGIYLLFSFDGRSNDCCMSDPPALSPDHRFSILVLIVLADIAYYSSRYRRELFPPIAEVAVNCLLMIGIVINILYMIQGQSNIEYLYEYFVVVILYLIMALSENHKRYTERFAEQSPQASGTFMRALHRLLMANAFIKYPLLLIFCLPLLAVIAMLLLLFGQKPDSMVQAFTDTYHHTFSIHDCTHVQCPSGHYLCTIAACGHETVVQPLRPGIRHGRVIKVNRQLLVANAFEELIAVHLPALHRPLRTTYDRVGDRLYAWQTLLDNKWMSDVVYYLMKPLEWLFILTLYIFDRKPENRIACQYISQEHRTMLK